MALPNYDRLLFIADVDTIANSAVSRSAVASYVSSNGFNGVYLAEGSFDTNAANINTLIGAINVIPTVGVGGNTTSATKIVTYNTTYDNVDNFLMYNNFWYDGSPFTTWLSQYDAITSISSSFWVTNYQDNFSANITASGYTEVGAAKAQITATNQDNELGVLLSIFEQGVPRYFSSANDKKSTNVFNKLDILAQATKELNLNNKLPIHFYIHAGQVDLGSSEDFSGYSIQAAGSFDEFEKKLLKTIVNRMTKFQRDYLDVKGFAYYKYPYAQAALAPPSCVTGITIVPGSTTAFIDWSDGPGGIPTSYDVYLDTNSNPSASATPVNTVGSSITVTGLNPSTTYYVAVIAKNNIGAASGCTTSNFTTTSTPVTPPSVLGNYRMMYVNDSAMSSTITQNDMLTYAQAIGVNTLLVYGGWYRSGTSLASFISRSRSDYGMQKVSCVVTGRYQAELGIAYNDSRTNASEKWDDFCTENEFWRGSGWSEAIKCTVKIENAVAGATYTIRINGIDYTITAASTNESSVATQLYNQMTASLGGNILYNTIGFSKSGDEITILRSDSLYGAVTWGAYPAPQTNNTNIFTSGSLVAVSSSYNPDKISCPIYVEVKYNGVIVSGDRTPSAPRWGTDNPNYDQSKISINDSGIGSPTLTYLSLVKYLHSESVSRGNEWTVTAYVSNYGSPGSSSNRWRLVEAKYMVENIDIFQATNYVTTIGFNSDLKGKTYYLADAARIYGAKPSQSFVPLWSGQVGSYFGASVLPTYRSNFYPNVSGGLDQLESDWSASYAAAVPFTTRSYLDFIGASYFAYTPLQIATGATYKFP